jgi:hypothetical protein
MLAMALLLSMLASGTDGIPMTVDLSGDDPGTWEDWVASEPEVVPLVVTPLFQTPGTDGRSPQLAVLIEVGLADSLEPGTLEQWAADMAPFTGEVLVAEATYSTDVELRTWLQEAWQDGLEGVILVGDLPAAWVAMDNAFLRDSEMFPADYFFMDLDGDWQDNWIGYPSQGVPGSDGKWDTWGTADPGPEIYCARMKTSNLTVGTESGLIQDYLDRNHEWRTYGDQGLHRALCYVDNDWAVWGPEFQNAMRALYPDVELVNQVDSTCGTDYEEDRLTFPYIWISPYVHSGPTLHQWNPGPETLWNEIIAIDPQARFYNLFACSNARFTTPRNMGSIYTFATTAGLAAVGSTKSGSMLTFEAFYTPLGEGANLGDAYRAWWEQITSGGFTPYEKSWHLGMVLIGDPTLRPQAELYGIPGGGIPGPSGLALRSNPCRGMLGVDVPATGTVSVFDCSGRLAASAGAVSAGMVELDLSGLPAGTYSCVFRTGGAEPSAALFVLLP